MTIHPDALTRADLLAIHAFTAANRRARDAYHTDPFAAATEGCSSCYRCRHGKHKRCNSEARRRHGGLDLCRCYAHDHQEPA